jgi:hypothetical protein
LSACADIDLSALFAVVSPTWSRALAFATKGCMLDGVASSCAALLSSAFLALELFEAILPDLSAGASAGFFARCLATFGAIEASGVSAALSVCAAESDAPVSVSAARSGPAKHIQSAALMTNAESPLVFMLMAVSPFASHQNAQGALPACPHRGKKRESSGERDDDFVKNGANGNMRAIRGGVRPARRML